jgi:hypothetical protein
MWNKPLRTAAQGAALALFVWQGAAWAGDSDVVVERGSVRGQDAVCDPAEPGATAVTGHRRRSKTHGANSTWCGVADDSDARCGAAAGDGGAASLAADKGHRRRSKTHGANSTWCGVTDDSDERCDAGGSGDGAASLAADKGHRRRSKTHGANSTWCGVTDEDSGE